MKADIVVLCPYTYIDREEALRSGTDNSADIYIAQMNEILKYEVAKNTYSNLVRRRVGAYQFQFYENYPQMHYKKLKIISGTVYLVLEARTNLCLCEILFTISEESPLTYYLDAISKEDINIILDRETGLNVFMLSFGLKPAGVPKCCVFLSEVPSERELLYLLASEFYNHDDVAFIKSNDLDEKLKNNLSQYDFMECYSSSNCAVHIMRSFEEKFSDRFYFEGLSVFITELILFNITAILRTNARVVSELVKGAEPSYEVIKSINLEYAQTITLWNINIFRSVTAQIAAQKFYTAFEVDKIVDTYNRNQKLMEHVMNVKTAMREEFQNKVLNIAAFLLTVIQCGQFLYAVIMSIINRSIHTLSMAVGMITATFAAVFVFLIQIRNKRKKQKDKLKY